MEHLIELLEFKKVCNAIAEYASSYEGRFFCKNISPIFVKKNEDKKKIEYIKKFGDDCLNLIEKSILPPLKNLPPIKPFLQDVKEGKGLEIEGIYAIFLTLILVRDLQKWKAKKEKEASQTQVYKSIARLSNLDEPYHVISSFLDESGNIKDIPSLRAITKKQMAVENEIKKIITRYFNDPSVSSLLQSDLATTKNNRTVLACKANFKGKIKGIIHEYSHSAKTFYIEPEDVVLKNNEIEELKAEWEREYFSILRRLTNIIFEHVEKIEEAVNIIIEFDSISAFAKWAKKNNCHFLTCCDPCMDDGSENIINLVNAHHPLIKNCVPINITTEKEKKVLVISGANAGGKTVALKTIALLSLMNMAGFPLPADKKSSLPYFDFIGCVIGDEQSIEGEVSTFSAEIKNISFIIKEATNKSLALFDEIASGTDVEEGAAIAMAILDEMIEKKTFTIVTTHHGVLKKYAFSNDSCINASVEFDSQSLEPTYKIINGLPGESHAIDVAIKMGFNDKIIKRAKDYMKKHSSNISNLITTLMEKQKEIEKREENIKIEEKKLLESKREYDLKMLSLRQRELELKKGALKDANKLFSDKKKEIENLVRNLKEGKIEKNDTQKLKEWKESVAEVLKQEEINICNENENLCPEKDFLTFDEIKIGMRVCSFKYKKEGVVLRFEKNNSVLVSFDGIKLTLPTKDLQVAKNIKEESLKPIYEFTPDGLSLYELKILGLRVEEAKNAILNHFDKLILNDVKEFSIVHGKGDGVLQGLVKELLSSSNLVKEFSFARPEFGGAGKTIVKLK